MHDFEKLTRRVTSPARDRRWPRYLVVALALLVGLGTVAGALSLVGEGDQVSGVEKPRITGLLETLSSDPNEPQNILVLGVDRRPTGTSAVEGTRADTMMLVRVHPKTGRIRIVSIPRDLLVEIEPGVEDKINAAYAYGGVTETVRAVENFAGVYIDHYAIVDFTGFEALVNALGGLRIDVEEDQVPPNWKVKDGVQMLKGRKALVYARYRDTPGGDLDRIRRQQEVLAALRSQALRWRSVEKFPQITRAVVENVETDMSLAEIASLGRSVSKRGRNGVMTSTQLKGTPETLSSGSKVLIPDEEANEVLLREFRD